MRIKGAYTEEKAYQDFHKKTGIQITGAPILDIDETLSAEIEELFYEIDENLTDKVNVSPACGLRPPTGCVFNNNDQV